nr:MAG TPA: hypothetical protein [Caudoviricetes sp.]DAP53869.1 MAG TPA: hypothetical protein [Caudoviricetes sp.]
MSENTLDFRLKLLKKLYLYRVRSILFRLIANFVDVNKTAC